jgi:hypothetical protein
MISEQALLLFPGLYIVDKERIIQYYNRNNVLFGRTINKQLRFLK